jgi:hypothetical protein
MAYIPSPSTGEGRVGVKMRYSLLPYSLGLPPIPTFPRQGGRSAISQAYSIAYKATLS